MSYLDMLIFATRIYFNVLVWNSHIKLKKLTETDKAQKEYLPPLYANLDGNQNKMK